MHAYICIQETHNFPRLKLISRLKYISRPKFISRLKRSVTTRKIHTNSHAKTPSECAAKSAGKSSTSTFVPSLKRTKHALSARIHGAFLRLRRRVRFVRMCVTRLMLWLTICWMLITSELRQCVFQTYNSVCMYVLLCTVLLCTSMYVCLLYVL